MRTIIFILPAIFPILLFGQKNNLQNTDSTSHEIFITPYYAHENYKTFGVIGKALPGPTGQGWFCITSLGIEYGFCKNNSIGIHGYFNGIIGYDDNSRANSEIDKGLLISFRHFVNCGGLFKKFPFSFYSGPVIEFGQKRDHNDKYAYHDSIFSSLNMNYTSYGILTGILHKFKHQRWGFDANIAWVYNTRNITTNYFSTNPPSKDQFRTYNLEMFFSIYCWLFTSSVSTRH